MLKIKRPISCLASHIAKSDRVNALRKQYDAFLEQDQKRKERNEYILGRLGNMRYSSTAVQIRHKPVVYGDVLPVFSHGAYRPEQLERRDIQIAQPTQQPSHNNNQNLQVDVPRKYLDDTSTSLLKEISKKYILIPKLRPSLIDDYVRTIPSQTFPPVKVSPPQTNITNNDDWKSKYDILEQLKIKEKQEQTNNDVKDELYPVKESPILSKGDSKVIAGYDQNKGIDVNDPQNVSIDSYDLQNYNTKEFTTKYEREVPEKDLTSDKVSVESEPHNVEKYKISDSKDQEPSTDHAPKSSAAININTEINAVNDYSTQSQGLEHNAPIVESVVNTSIIEENLQQNKYPKENPEYNTEEATHVYNDNERQLTENSQQGEYPVEYEEQIVDEGKYPDPANVYLDPDDYSPIEVLNNNEFIEKLQTGTKEDEGTEYPVEMLNVQEFTPNNDVVLVDGVNVNPHYLASEQNIESALETNPKIETITHTQEPQDSSGIEAFDAEQKEMFYSEETEEYAYDQQQQAAGEAYTQEYTPAESYPEQAPDYSYYESTAGLQEQEYPIEVNEHEETSTRYDPNYEQQYANYEQQENEQGQEQQQYVEPTESYEQTQQQYHEYEYQQPDQETVQNVEQVLDNELGFPDAQNSEAYNEEKPVEQLKQPAEQLKM